VLPSAAECQMPPTDMSTTARQLVSRCMPPRARAPTRAQHRELPSTAECQRAAGRQLSPARTAACIASHPDSPSAIECTVGSQVPPHTATEWNQARRATGRQNATESLCVACMPPSTIACHRMPASAAGVLQDNNVTPCVPPYDAEQYQLPRRTPRR
jgi:hypothetical protein